MFKNKCHLLRSALVSVVLASLPVVVKAAGHGAPAPRERGPVCAAIMVIIALIGALDIFAVRKDRRD